MNLPSDRKRHRLTSFQKIFLLLSIFSIVFYCVAFTPIATIYKTILEGKAEEKDRKSHSNVPAFAKETESTVMRAAPKVLRKSTNPLSHVKAERNAKEAAECRLELEEYLYPKIYQWVTEKVPIAFGVKIVKDQYYVIFNTGYIDPDIWYDAKYFCNDYNNITATVLSSTKPGRGNLIIQCPAAIDYKKEMLQYVSIIPREGNITSYEMEEFVKCEEQDTIHFSPLNASIGMCTNIVGKGTDRDNALQWVEYHRIIGVDHTWIYVDSDWDENKQPDRPYLSWVPYNFDIETFNFTDRPWTEQNELFRVTSQVECLLRARRMGMEWIIFTDIDEYVQVVDNSTIFGDDQHILKHLLNTYYKDERDKIGGLVMNSIPFGNNLEIEKKPTKTLMIDHVYRNKINPKLAKWIRWI